MLKKGEHITFVGGGGDDGDSPLGQNISLISSPATTILIAEKQDADGGHLNNLDSVGNGSDHTEAVLYPNNGFNTSGTDGNGFNIGNVVHNGQSMNNYAFCDGHVKALKANGGGAQGTKSTPGDQTVCTGWAKANPCVTGVGNINLVNDGTDGWTYGWGLWNIKQQ